VFFGVYSVVWSSVMWCGLQCGVVYSVVCGVVYSVWCGGGMVCGKL
jgi:hypothetical protein